VLRSIHRVDADVFLQGAEILFEIATHFNELKYLDFGSGFKVSYKDDGIETDIKGLGKKISKRFNEFCKKENKDLTLIFEPGKYLVSEAGYFFVRAMW
ncbi:MAG TPA: diaminopimelate decarboxylase, partial [Saprospiraceae bacterium]|nr:diaminopimelate decarboxylase [Saprospiraceae bacterium]